MENQDRELLELAAKAAGVELQPMEVKNVSNVGDDRFIGYMVSADKWPRGWFNPLTDDGDALRLAVRLGITIGPESPDVIGKSLCRASWNNRRCSLGEYGDGDIYAATRRAIVRAAAEIGRGME